MSKVNNVHSWAMGVTGNRRRISSVSSLPKINPHCPQLAGRVVE
jgi:hypothetical protein